MLLYFFSEFSISKLETDKSKSRGGSDSNKEGSVRKDGNNTHIAAQTFTFRELAAATKNFREDCLLGEGGFGRVYKGRLENGQVRLSNICLHCRHFMFAIHDSDT